VRILSHLLAEISVVALLGGAAGTVIAVYGAYLLGAHGPASVRILTSSAQGFSAFLWIAACASVVTGIACGALPAWQLFRKDAARRLQEGGGRNAVGGESRSRQVLVAVQMALGTALLASASLLLHSFVKVMGADRGYQVERVLAVDLSLFGRGQDSIAFYRQLSENTRTLPGVLAAGVINNLPVSGESSGASRAIFHATDVDIPRLMMQRPVAMIRSVTGGFFSASGTSLRAGRYCTDQEQEPVGLVSESLAARLWPGEPLQSVIGRQIKQGGRPPNITVVGVVGDVRAGAVEREVPPILYRPYAQWASGYATLVVRTEQNPAALAPAVRAEIRKLNATIPIPAIRTMREIVSEAVEQRQFQMVLTMLFAVVALVLGAVGVYGVVSYYVTCRTREIGLRLALGAMRGEVMAWILARGMKPVLIGLAVGLSAAIAIAMTLRSLLFGIVPTDPVALGVVVAVLLATSGLACYVPARRAARVDPILALRHE
jgi:putative ABC transport system permease protein